MKGSNRAQGSHDSPVVDGRAVRDEELIMLENPGLYDFHQGGSPRFGPDGMLYLGIGDGTVPVNVPGTPIRCSARSFASTCEVRPPEHPYRIPPDNPLLS